MRASVKALELTIPPPLLALLIAGLMWCWAKMEPASLLSQHVRLSLTLLLWGIGTGFLLAGVVSFRRAQTTVNPLKPEASSALVCSGIYRLTRNPMYLGMACLLLAWACWLDNLWGLLGVLAFVLYITRFQIVPEERVLVELFGDAYRGYCARVRRWL